MLQVLMLNKCRITSTRRQFGDFACSKTYLLNKNAGFVVFSSSFADKGCRFFTTKDIFVVSK